MGRYGDEMFRSCRLVVDTGLHYFGWSREQAIRYIAERTPRSLPMSGVEVDRYLTWPGQACSYKIGELKIKELRQKVERALGSKFDVRDFHSVLTANDKLPLRVMETIVTDYIADTSKVKPPTAKPTTGRGPFVHCLTAGSVGLYLLTSLIIAVIHH